jgi:hypothetical protein
MGLIKNKFYTPKLYTLYGYQCYNWIIMNCYTSCFYIGYSKYFYKDDKEYEI